MPFQKFKDLKYYSIFFKKVYLHGKMTLPKVDNSIPLSWIDQGC